MTRSPTCSTSFHACGWNVSITAFFDVKDGGQVWVVTGTNGENRLRAEGATCAEAWRQVLDQAAVVEMCRVGLGRRGSRGRQGAWRCASEEGPGAVLSRANGGVLPVGWERKPWPRAGRNRSWMIHTPRVRAADLYRDQGRRADLQIGPQSSASIANCCTKLALTSLSPS